MNRYLYMRYSSILQLGIVSAGLVCCLLPTGCSKSGGTSGGASGQKITLQNKGSDTMVNLAQAWAEEYKKARSLAMIGEDSPYRPECACDLRLPHLHYPTEDWDAKGLLGRGGLSAAR